ncbi:protein of unknown function [Shewanella benthica]|uniref:Uncharacterized protein n=1 Tax=Shewanella benthica TaxID=43661 RepID=A0A330M525_9GAMM|nr:protein of unknown function [Shewanella benthica]
MASGLRNSGFKNSHAFYRLSDDAIIKPANAGFILFSFERP